MTKATGLMYVLIPHASGIATGTPQMQAPLAAAPVNGGEQGLLLVANTVLNGGGAGFPVSILGLDDNTDNVAPQDGTFVQLFQGDVVRLTGYDPVGNNWDRLRTAPDNADAQAALTLGLQAVIGRLQGWNDAGAVWQRLRTQNDNGDALATGIGHLATISHPVVFNGATWDRLRSNAAGVLSGATQPFAALSAPPGEWAVNSEPAVSTQATATKAAGGAGVRHVCRSLHFSLAAVAAQTIIYARVRDGASGAGTVLWSQGVIVPAGSAVTIQLSDLNIVGSANTAMTFEWSAAPVATNFETAGGTGYSTV